MLRPPIAQCLRAIRSTRPRTIIPSHRFLSTAPPAKQSRSWKNASFRWLLAGGLLYVYNTSTVLAEELPHVSDPQTTRTENRFEANSYKTIDELSTERRARKEAQVAKQSPSSQTPDAEIESSPGPGEPEDLEAEAGQQGAFNEETGEINWDCPCLGGMANGPCGEQFREAFSCFVYSKEEPKGMECIEKFKAMQDCFREHPDVYGAELEEDEEEENAEVVGEAVPSDMTEQAGDGARYTKTSKTSLSTHNAETDVEIPVLKNNVGKEHVRVE